MAKLPTVTSPLPRDLQQFVQRVREALDNGGPDAVVTARQLIAAGVVGSSTSGGITPIGGTIETPRAPSGLTASGALASIIVSWNGPQYKGHAYTEIWAHTSDVIGDAVLVGMTAGNSFAHTLGAAATRYYWVRNVNQNGVVSAFNATNGTQGETGEDAAYLLSVLSGEITSTELASSLGTRIDLIDGAANVAGSVNARIAAEATNTTNALALKADASTVTTLAATVGSNTSAISAETTARTTADTSLASDITTLQTTTGGHTTSIQTNATSINGLKGQYTVKIDNNGHVAGFGLASELIDGVVSSDFMISADRFSVVNPTAVGWYDIIKITDYGNSQRAVFVSQTLATSFSVGDTIKIFGHPDGHNGDFTITNTGSISGTYFVAVSYSGAQPLGLLTTTEASAADVRATKAGAAPFVIATGSTQINGVTVPAGTYIDSAMIADATITNAKIGDAAIDSAKIANATIVAGDIADATITGAKIDSATITNANIATGTITSANIQNGTIQEADIGNAQISNAKIKDVIQSSSYSAGSAGWKIDKSGSAEFNDATFRGTLDVGGSSGSRMTISSTKIEVYDGSTLRVKIGDLS